MAISNPRPNAPQPGGAAGQLLGDLGRRRVDLRVVRGPGVRVPDLEVVGNADHDAWALAEGGVGDQVLRDPHPSRGVECLVVRAAVEAPSHHSPIAAQRIELRQDLLLESRVVGRRIHLDAGVQTGAENHSIGERGSKPGRDRKPVLGVEVVLVVTAKRQP